MKISGLDHLVLTVQDMNKTLDFYVKILGMEKEIFNENRVALKFGNQKINLHELGNEFEPKAANVKAGSADLCFITQMPLEEVIMHIMNHNVPIEQGLCERTGAMGGLSSIYLRDPDGNLIEISNTV